MCDIESMAKQVKRLATSKTAKASPKHKVNAEVYLALILSLSQIHGFVICEIRMLYIFGIALNLTKII